MSPRLSPRTGDRGVTAVEYALIVFLVAIAMLIGVVLLQRSLGTAFAASADSAGGSVSRPSQTQSSNDSCPSDGEDHEDDDCDDAGNNNEANNNSTPTKPGAPTGVTATRSANGEITVSWTAPGNDGGRTITGYTVEFETETQVSTCDSSVSGWDNGSASGGPSATSAKETGLGSEWYCVRVYASNGVTSGSTNYAYAGPVFTGAGRPGAPTSVTAVRSANGAVTVSWTAPQANGGSAITSFPIGYENDGVTSSSTCGAGSGDYTDATDSGASSDTSETETGLGADWYCVRIAADNSGTGALNYAYAGPVFSGAVKPAAPTGVTATKSGSNEIKVSWTPPTDDGGSAITSFPIGYEDDGITSSSVCSASSGNYADKTDSGDANETSEKQNGLSSGWYCIRIAAENAGTGSLNYAYVGPVNAG